MKPKITLQKKYYTPNDLADRWECSLSDVEDLIATGELHVVDKHGALHRGGRPSGILAIPYNEMPLLTIFNTTDDKDELEELFKLSPRAFIVIYDGGGEEIGDIFVVPIDRPGSGEAQSLASGPLSKVVMPEEVDLFERERSGESNAPQTGHIQVHHNGVTVNLPHMTKNLEELFRIMHENWGNYDPKRPPKQINIGREMDESFGLGKRGAPNSEPSRNAKVLAKIIKPDSINET